VRSSAYTRGPKRARGRRGRADFTAFVERHEARLLTACRALTGNDATAVALREDLLAATALRWRWYAWRHPAARDRAGEAVLDRLLHREQRTWRPERSARPVEFAPLLTATGAVLAGQAWQRAKGLRRRRRLLAVMVAAGLALVWTFGPAMRPGPEPEPDPGPVGLPAGVVVLPPYGRLSALGTADTELPDQIHLDLQSAQSLDQAPVAKAIAVLRPDLGPLVLLAPDGSIRTVSDTRLLSAQTLTTSLSPDGTRVALPAAEGLLVLDVATATLRTIPVPAARLGGGALTWRTPTSVVLPGVDGALEVQVDTGVVGELPGLSGYDVMTVVGVAEPSLTELLAATLGVDHSRIRVWGAPDNRQLPDRSRRSEGSAPAVPAYQDRVVGGPLWLDNWTGPGWSTGSVAARGCSARSLPLPNLVGRPRSAVGAVGVTGAYAGTLVAVDTTVLEVVGFSGPRRVLVAVHAPQIGTTVVAWYPHTAQIRRVSTVDAYAHISLADLFHPA
jgi:hypothetical protein